MQLAANFAPARMSLKADSCTAFSLTPDDMTWEAEKVYPEEGATISSLTIPSADVAGCLVY